MSAPLLQSILDTIDQFERHEIGIADTQLRLDAVQGAIDRRLSHIVGELRLVSTDLEEIQFTMMTDDQEPAASFRLDRLKEIVAVALEDLE